LQVFVSSKCRKKGKSHDPINRGSRRRQRHKHHTLTAAAGIRYIEVRSNSMEPCCLVGYLARPILVRTVNIT
jgi:hypothetical protein